MFLKRTQETPVIKWPVTASEPRDGGVIRKHHFTAHYKLYPVDESNALASQGDYAFIEAVLAGFEDVNDEETKEPIHFSAEIRSLMMSKLWLKNAIVNGYWQMASGLAAKNS